MKIFNKVRWRIEKYILDPLIRPYLFYRLYEDYRTTKGQRIYTVSKNMLHCFPAHDVFQFLIAGGDTANCYQEEFNKAFLRGMQNEPFYDQEYVRYRVYLNSIIASYAKLLPGHFVTIGVSWGIVPRTIFEYTQMSKTEKKYYLIDTWEGLLYSSEKTLVPNYCSDFNFIKKEFKEDNFVILRGLAPQIITELQADSISFLHMNTGDRKAEVKTLELLWNQISTPGFVVIDNYHYSDLEGMSFDLFLQRFNSKVILFPNGQGLIIKV